MAFSTQIKNLANKLINPLGFNLSTTRLLKDESARLNSALRSGHWSESRYQAGLSINDSSMLSFLERAAIAYRKDYDALTRTAAEISDEHTFYLHNGWFESVDAEILYAMIRLHKPSQIIEVGSGNSTRLMWKAIQDGGLSTRVLSIDPQPRIPIIHQFHEHLAAHVETLPPVQLLRLLNGDDILFIDSSHIVSSAGDIPYLFLEILPQLKSGVIVHIHDIFIPFDYPEKFIVDNKWAWTEQYLVHAFLAYNAAFDILWASRYIWEYYRESVENNIASSSSLQIIPSSLWIQRR